jgi:hypothetical protein
MASSRPASSLTPPSSMVAPSSSAQASSSAGTVSSSASLAGSGSSAAAPSSSATSGGAITWNGPITEDVPAGSQVTFVMATIAAGVTVTVHEGVTFTGSGKVLVSGTLNIQGTTLSPVTLAGVGVEVESGGAASVSHATLANAPAVLSVKAGAGAVTLSYVTSVNAAVDLDIRGGTVLVDHCDFTLGGGTTISGAGVRPEIRNSHLNTGSAFSSDFLILNGGGEVYAHHNDFDGEHCAIHINDGGAATFEYNVFHNTSYTIMKFNAAQVLLNHNNIGNAAPGGNAFDATAGIMDATGNYFVHGCTAVDDAVTTYGCATAPTSPVAGAGIQP